MYPRKWTRRDPETDIFYKLLGNDRTRPTILFLWDQLFEAEWECSNIEEYYLAELEKAKRRVEDLEARFLKDSHNSHKPPSSDLPHKPKRTRSLRSPQGLKPGGQEGHPGHHLIQVPNPNETRIYPVYHCARCGHALKALPVTQHELRQVIDLKNGKKWITEHRAEMKLCPKCDSMNHGGFPPEARAYVCYGAEVRRTALYLVGYHLMPLARTCELFLHLFGLEIKPGSLHRFSVEASRKLKEWENEAKKQIIGSDVAHFDETGIRTQGNQHWLHGSSTATYSVFAPHEKRGQEAMDDIGILPDFKGTAVHDGWTPYFNYEHPGIEHSLCNVHHLRELTFVEETEEERWAVEMKKLLLHALHHQHQRQEKGLAPSRRWVRSIKKRYDRILKKGYRSYREHMPKHPSQPRAGPQERRDTGHNLLRRLHFYKAETLAFLTRPGVPFSNNQAERDIRMFKVKQKISGCFRSWGGAKAFCRVRSFLITARKQCKNPFHALQDIFPPVIPTGVLATT